MKNVKKQKKIQTYSFILRGHKKFITALSWKPYNLDLSCDYLVSASKDNSIKIWSTKFGKLIKTSLKHTKSVTSVVWSGQGYIYSASQDCSIYMYDEKLNCLKLLKGHSHWVNCLSLNTDYALKCGFL